MEQLLEGVDGEAMEVPRYSGKALKATSQSNDQLYSKATALLLGRDIVLQCLTGELKSKVARWASQLALLFA